MYDARSRPHYNYRRDYDPATGRYVETDPIGQRFYFNLSNLPRLSRHRGYWNHLYNYVDSNPASLRDPTGLGVLDWLLDLFKEKAPEESMNKALGAGLAVLCVQQNCGKKRDSIELWGDCAHFVAEWVKKQDPEVIAGISGATADGGQAVISECAEMCEKGINSGSCCKGAEK